MGFIVYRPSDYKPPRPSGESKYSIFRKVRPSGGFIDIDIDTSEMSQWCSTAEGIVARTALAPQIISGRFGGGPTLLNMLKALTPKDTRRKGRRSGPHIADGWVESQSEAITNPLSQTTSVSLYNASAKASNKLLMYLELGVRPHTITNKTDRVPLTFFYKGKWWKKHQVEHPGFRGRYFMKKVKAEAAKRMEKYLAKVIAEAGAWPSAPERSPFEASRSWSESRYFE